MRNNLSIATVSSVQHCFFHISGVETGLNADIFAAAVALREEGKTSQV